MSLSPNQPAASDGPSHEIAALYAAYQRPLIGYLTRLLSDRETAEDICHDSFARALAKWPTHQAHGGNTVAWLYRIATNAAYDELRRRKRRHVHTLSTAAELPDERVSLEAHVGDSIEVAAALALLPEHERVPLVLQYYGGRKVREIALLTDATPAATKTRLLRARARFRSAIAGPAQANSRSRAEA